MNAGVYKATTGLLHQASRLDSITENLANVSKPGYRRTVISTRPFVGAVQEAIDKHNFEDGTRVNVTAVDFTPAPMRQTERALDFAIEGDAFFVLEKEGHTFYTRDGTFAVDAERRLVNASGLTVPGNIVIPADAVLNDLTVGSDGTLFNGNQALGRIELAAFEDPHRLERAGPTLFTAPEDMPPEAPGPEVKVHNRMQETSNTTIFAEMAEMIACMRNFEACQKMIMMQDTVEGSMITKINQP